MSVATDLRVRGSSPLLDSCQIAEPFQTNRVELGRQLYKRQNVKQQGQLQWRNRGCSGPVLSSDCFLLKEHATKVH